MIAIPLVSILINNYNYGRFLPDAIDSALSQTYSPLEIIVVDDGSTDDSRLLISAYGSSIIPVFKENGGQASAFNAGVAACRGEILCFLDSDDYFYPSKVGRIVELFAGLNMATPLMVHHRLRITQEDGETPQEEFLGRTHDNPLNLAQYARKYKFMQFAAGSTTGLAINRRMCDLLFPLPIHIKVSADDFIVYGSSLIGELHSSGEILGAYRVHGTNRWYSRDRSKSRQYIETRDQYLNEKLKENNLPGRISYFESMWCWRDLAAEQRWTALFWRMLKLNIVQHDRHTLGFTYAFTYGIGRFAARRLSEKILPAWAQQFCVKGTNPNPQSENK